MKKIVVLIFCSKHLWKIYKNSHYSIVLVVNLFILWAISFCCDCFMWLISWSTHYTLKLAPSYLRFDFHFLKTSNISNFPLYSSYDFHFLQTSNNSNLFEKVYPYLVSAIVDKRDKWTQVLLELDVTWYSHILACFT